MSQESRERKRLEREADGLVCRECGHADFEVRSATHVYRVGQQSIEVTTLAMVCRHCGWTLLDRKASRQVDRAVRAARDKAATHSQSQPLDRTSSPP